MTDHDDIVEQLAERCRAANLEVERDGDRLALGRGRGGGGARAILDAGSFLDTWADEPDEARERAMASYVSGAHHVLLEPEDSDGDEMEFPEAAGRLLMRIEHETFEPGAASVAESPPWTRSFHDDLILVFLIELDMGMRVLDRAQFEAWGVSPDRVSSAARSMLYHKANNTAPIPVEEYEAVEQLRVGDGCDAARILILEDLFFGEFDDSSRIAIPGSEELLFVRSGTETGVEALEEAAEAYYDDADAPLTTSLFRFERGDAVAVETD